ncbi:sugar transport protein 8, partial [Amborella trichopoda]
RGSLNILFQLLITVGISIANLVNYWASSLHPWGWRLSLGLAGVPAALLCFGSLLIVETPTSLIERGKSEKGKATLERIRGTKNVEPEFQQLVKACETASEVKHPYHRLMRRDGHPRLFISIILQVFQQLTGINAIMFYAPVLFQTMGFKNDASLLSAVITGLVNVIATFVSIAIVDRVGRKALLLQAAVQMFICQGAIGIILLKDLHLTNSLNPTVAIVVVILVCCYVASFAWSWGPLGWLIPSEIFPLETRSAGFSFAVCSNMLFTFLIAQAFLSMMCHLKAGIFFFFAGWILIMGTFVVFFLPETKGVPIDQMTERVWKKHWLWARFMAEETNRV